MTKLRAAYRRAYNAYLMSGLSKAAFYRECLSDYLPEGAQFPAKSTFYIYFDRVQKELAAAEEPNGSAEVDEKIGDLPVSEFDDTNGSTAIKVRRVGRHIRFAEVSAMQLQNACVPVPNEIAPDRRFSNRAFHPRRETGPTVFCMRLPNGTEIKFETRVPELVAMEMLRISSGSRQ